MIRGKLTKKINKVAKDFLEREIDTTELRLYAYLDYISKNGREIDPRRVNKDDMVIIEQLHREGHISEKGYKISLTKPFYDFMMDILWISYVENKVK